jgi:hypothetical protein
MACGAQQRRAESDDQAEMQIILEGQRYSLKPNAVYWPPTTSDHETIVGLKFLPPPGALRCAFPNEDALRQFGVRERKSGASAVESYRLELGRLESQISEWLPGPHGLEQAASLPGSYLGRHGKFYRAASSDESYTLIECLNTEAPNPGCEHFLYTGKLVFSIDYNMKCAAEWQAINSVLLKNLDDARKP